MSFFKTVAFVGIVIAILPSDHDNQRKLTQAALSVSSEARSFCEARPNICISREEAWRGFVSKAGFAVSLGQELIWGQHANATYFDATYARRSNDTIGTLLKSDYHSY